MKPLFDLFLKSKFKPLSCRTKSAMYLTETVSHTSGLSSGLSCQYQKRKKKKAHSKQQGFGDKSSVTSYLAPFIYFCQEL